MSFAEQCESIFVHGISKPPLPRPDMLDSMKDHELMPGKTYGNRDDSALPANQARGRRINPLVPWPLQRELRR